MAMIMVETVFFMTLFLCFVSLRATQSPAAPQTSERIGHGGVTRVTAADHDPTHHCEGGVISSRNAITWLLYSSGILNNDPMNALGVYTRQCSTMIPTDDLARMGATPSTSFQCRPCTHLIDPLRSHLTLALSLKVI